MAYVPENLSTVHGKAARQYTCRIPTPPRVLVPPPATIDSKLIDIELSRPSFLPSSIEEYEPDPTPESIASWSYNNRRQAQQILPYLYLGPMTVTKDSQWLQEHNITMILGVRSRLYKLTDAALGRASSLGIEANAVEVQQASDLIAMFQESHRMITTHVIRAHTMGTIGKVLVFCESGNDRSAIIVAAFIMEAHDHVDHIKAMQLVQSQRFCAVFGDDSKRILQSFWDILQARRDVAQHSACKATVLPSSRKRQLDRDDNDMDVDEDGIERFISGRHFVPFTDDVDELM